MKTPAVCTVIKGTAICCSDGCGEKVKLCSLGGKICGIAQSFKISSG